MRARGISIALLACALAGCSTSGIAPSSKSHSSVATATPTGLTVQARYDPAPTFTALIVPDFTPGREAELADLARSVCVGRLFCTVGVWTVRAFAPTRLKLTEPQVSARIVQYAMNTRTGLDRVAWNCAMKLNDSRICL